MNDLTLSPARLLPHRLRTGLIAVLAAVFAVAGFASPSAAQLRVVNYNIAQLRGDLNALEDVFAAINDDDSHGFAIAPHVYVFQEVLVADVSVLQSRLNAAAPAGVTYAAATFTSDNEDDFAGAQACFYRTDMLSELVSSHEDIYTGAGRRTDRWRFILLGRSTIDSTFYIYSSHLKASAGDEAERFDGVVSIRNNADALPQGSAIIYAGDMNFYNAFEAGYQEFFSAGNGRAVDPLTTSNWTSPAAAIKHTQSPRTINADGLVPGGMDDRFDFQLSTEEWHDGAGWDIIPGTYRALGNDGQHYDVAINLGTNTYFPGDAARSNALADDLHDASDHLPVVVDYQIPAFLQVDFDSNYDLAIRGRTIALPLTISNGAIVEHAVGADDLLYSVSTSGAVTGGPVNGSVPALGAPDIVPIGIDNATLGSKNGFVQVTSSSADVEPASFSAQLTVEVVDPANASFFEQGDIDARTIELDFDADTGAQSIFVDVFNFGYSSTQARLDVDAVESLAAPFAFIGGLESGLEFDAAVLEFSFDTDGLAPGDYQQAIDIACSDEHAAGEETSVITLTLDVTVGSGGTPADLNGDGTVNADDLFILLGNWGDCPAPCPSDLTGDGTVNADDLFTLLSQWSA